MKQPDVLLRVAAIASSLLLAGGFVAWRSGSFDTPRESSAPPVESQSKPPDVRTKPPTQETIFYGTKSGVISNPALIQDEPSEPAKPTPTLMSGSKSFAPLRFISGLSPSRRATSDLDVPLQAPASGTPPAKPDK